MSSRCLKEYTVESRFLEPSVSRTSRYLEPNLVSLGFASLKLYNITPDFSNPRFLETPDNSNQLWLPWDKLTLDNSYLRKFPNHLVPKIKTIIGQYQSYPFSVKSLRKSCISASMPILNVTTFPTHFSLVLDRMLN